MKFQVTWIGFWFNIPGVTSDPTQAAQNFFNTGYDVVLSAIDTTDARRPSVRTVLPGGSAHAGRAG